MLPQFDISTFSSQIFWLAVCLIILYFFVKYQVVRNIEALDSNRNCSLRSILEKSEANKIKAQKLLEESTRLETLSKAEANKIKDDIICKFRKEQDNKIAKVSLEIHRQQEKFNINLEKEINEFSKSLPQITEKLASIISNKVDSETSINKLK